jgi:hypothetical protein
MVLAMSNAELLDYQNDVYMQLIIIIQACMEEPLKTHQQSLPS